MGYLGATLTQVFTRAGGADVSLRDVTIAQMENGASECKWCHVPEACGKFWEILKKSVELRLASGEDSWLSLACGGLGHVSHEMGGGWRDEKARIERMCISLLKLKGNKKFRNWTEKSLRVFRISRFLFYLYGHSMYVLHIAISWLWYIT